jgi:hypothetical protein
LIDHLPPDLIAARRPVAWAMKASYAFVYGAGMVSAAGGGHIAHMSAMSACRRGHAARY